MKKQENTETTDLPTQNPTETTFENYPFGTGAYSKEHLDYTIKTFQKYTLTRLTYEDAHEIVANVLALHRALKED